MYLNLKFENRLALASLEKKLRLSFVKSCKKRINFFKYSLFQNVKEMFTCNQNLCASSTEYIDFKSENCLVVACLEKIQNFVG